MSPQSFDNVTQASMAEKEGWFTPAAALESISGGKPPLTAPGLLDAGWEHFLTNCRSGGSHAYREQKPSKRRTVTVAPASDTLPHKKPRKVRQ